MFLIRLQKKQHLYFTQNIPFQETPPPPLYDMVVDSCGYHRPTVGHIHAHTGRAAQQNTQNYSSERKATELTNRAFSRTFKMILGTFW